MKIFVLRHGQTKMNAKNLIMGRTDDLLSDEGKKQAEETGKKIAKFTIENQIDEIFCSPLKRAKQTAQFVQNEIEKTTGRKIKIIYDDNLIEQDYGNMEGTSRLSKEFAESKSIFAVPAGINGESQMKIAQRAYNFLDNLKSTCNANNVLLVTHGGICRVIASYFMPMTNSEYAAWRAQNCQIDEYKF